MFSHRSDSILCLAACVSVGAGHAATFTFRSLRNLGQGTTYEIAKPVIAG